MCNDILFLSSEFISFCVILFLSFFWLHYLLPYSVGMFRTLCRWSLSLLLVTFYLFFVKIECREMRHLNDSIIVLAVAQHMSAITRKRRIEEPLVQFHLWLCGHIKANMTLVNITSSYVCYDKCLALFISRFSAREHDSGVLWSFKAIISMWLAVQCVFASLFLLIFDFIRSMLIQLVLEYLKWLPRLSFLDCFFLLILTVEHATGEENPSTPFFSPIL